MTEPLGLSIGMTHLVAARVGRPPVMRRSILTVFNNRAPEVGAPGENPNLTEPGLVLSGFVERVGDPVPLVAADGTAHRGEQVLAEALDAMARSVDGGSPVAIAVPAHWGPGAVGA
ncbi:MAG: molecular chaperone, partial [Mycobacterium sp.]